MSEVTGAGIERAQSSIFRTVASDFYEFWVEPETSRVLFYTQHYFPREQRAFKPINKDTTWRELQVECWMATSMAVNLATDILEKVSIRVECPKCKTLVSNLRNHLMQAHTESV